MAKAKTKVILQQSVPHVGLVGEVIDVAPGFYRNFLAPRKLALVANPKSIKQLEHQKKIIEVKKSKEKAGALELKTRLEATAVSISHAAGEGDKLFGSVTAQELALALRANGFIVDRKLIQLAAPLKTVGTHSVEIKLHPEVVARVNVEVTKKEVEAKHQDADEAPKASRKAKKAEKAENAEGGEAPSEEAAAQ